MAFRVYCTKPKDRRFWLMFYTDENGKRRCRSSKKASKRDAEKAALDWEVQLSAGKKLKPHKKPPVAVGGPDEAPRAWNEFRTWFIENHLVGKSQGMVGAATTMLKHVDRILAPQSINDFTSVKVDHFRKELHDSLRPMSVESTLKNLRLMLRLAHRCGAMEALPNIQMPKINRRAGGRPITEKEFGQLIKATKARMGDVADSWVFLLRGVWDSGLRLTEAINVHWSDRTQIVPDLEKRVMYFAAGSHKAGGECTVPMTSQFIRLLQRVPKRKRVGYIFRPQKLAGGGGVTRSDHVGKWISKIGKDSGVVTCDDKNKFITMHDLRRGFGSRWAQKVMPADLKALMRHSSMETTMQYYLDQNAESIAARLAKL